MNFSRSYNIAMYGCVLAVVSAIMGIITSNGLYSITSAIVLLIGLGQAFFFLKCPKCNERLNVRGVKPKVCPHCKQRLKW